MFQSWEPQAPSGLCLFRSLIPLESTPRSQRTGTVQLSLEPPSETGWGERVRREKGHGHMGKGTKKRNQRNSGCREEGTRRKTWLAALALS